jgi:hypothetical protein
LLLQVDIVLIAKETDVEVQRVTLLGAGNVDVASRVRVGGVVTDSDILLLRDG